MENEIHDITTAYNYIYYVANKQAEYNEEKMLKAKTFFTEQQLQDMNLVPEIITNSCFEGLCDKFNM